MAWPERVLWAVVLSSALVAPVERRGGFAVRCAAATRRSCGARLPQAGVREMVEPAVEDLGGGAAIDQAGVVERVVQDGGAQVPRSADFPAARGILPVQAMSGGVAAGFAGASCCAVRMTLGC